MFEHSFRVGGVGVGGWVVLPHGCLFTESLKYVVLNI